MAHTPHTLKVIAQLEQLKTPGEPIQNPFDPRSPMFSRTPLEDSESASISLAQAPDTPTTLTLRQPTTSKGKKITVSKPVKRTILGEFNENRQQISDA